jgi:uncharacterized protein with HEPN domain
LSRAEIDRLYDILEAIDRAEEAVGGLDAETFAGVEHLVAALCHYVLIISGSPHFGRAQSGVS